MNMTVLSGVHYSVQLYGSDNSIISAIIFSHTGMLDPYWSKKIKMLINYGLKKMPLIKRNRPIIESQRAINKCPPESLLRCKRCADRNQKNSSNTV